MEGILNQAHIPKDSPGSSKQVGKSSGSFCLSSLDWSRTMRAPNLSLEISSYRNGKHNERRKCKLQITTLLGEDRSRLKWRVAFHPALFHVIDVANVARGLLNEEAPVRFRNVFSEIYQIDPSSLSSFLPFLIALHDIGKFSSAFQRMNPLQHNRMLSEGFSFGSSHDLSHNQIGRNFIWYEWPETHSEDIRNQ